jgi:uncharacterized membrane-anchored protein YhcB (DUF1043 family)
MSYQSGLDSILVGLVLVLIFIGYQVDKFVRRALKHIDDLERSLDESQDRVDELQDKVDELERREGKKQELDTGQIGLVFKGDT